MLVAGLMSGTSADGIDAVVVRVPPRPSLETLGLVTHHHRPYAAAEREAIFALFDPPQATAAAICEMSFRIGEWFAAAADSAIRAAGYEAEAIDLIGSHGQTIYHCPPGTPGIATPCTLQIGEPAVIAERTGVTTVADFRVRDVAAGGHGAPLVSYVDQLLFRDPQITRAILNIGGIANVTVLPPATARDCAPLAFDTGPGNMVLDWLAQQLSGGALACDLDGQLAAAGDPDTVLLNELLDDEYFRQPPPKTTGRERFGAAYAARLLAHARARGLSAAGTLATATALTAETIARALEAAEEKAGRIREVIAGGGGTRNPVLMRLLAARLGQAHLTTHEAYGISSQAKEALSFAILAAAAVRGEPNSVPSCTGAWHATVMGKIVPGRNYAALMRRLFREAA